jgi:nitrogen-specific signal transduction histidine kinase
MERTNARMSTNLKSTDLGSISSVLEHVYLPAVLGSLPNDALLVWNSAFEKRVGLSQNELARTPLTSLLILEEKEADLIMEGHDAKRDNQLQPCVLKNPLTEVHGQTLRSDDGTLLAILDVTFWDLVIKEFDQARQMGCDEERNRTRHFFHDVLSSKILIASFLAHEIYQKLSASGAEETEDMARLTKLLQEAIDAIVHGAEAY